MKEEKITDLIFNFGWAKLIGGLSVILFLTDYGTRTGKWWFGLIAAFFLITSYGAAIKEISKNNKKKIKKLEENK